MTFLTVIVGGYPINLVGIMLLVFYGITTYLVDRIPKFGLQTSASISGWVTSFVGLIILVVSGVLTLSMTVFIAVGGFAFLTLVSVLVSLFTRTNPIRAYNSVLTPIYRNLPKIGILLGIVFSALNLILIR